MSNHRTRIFSSMLIAFIIINIYANFAGLSEVVANFRLPKFKVGKLFTLNFDNNRTIEQSNNSTPDLIGEFNDSNEPEVNYDLVSPEPSPVNDLTDVVSLSPTINNNLKPSPTIYNPPTTYKSPTPYPLRPTSYHSPKPTVTKYIKPTKVPPAPPITTDLRPGTTLKSVFEEVSKRACIPTALLLAFQTEESGAFFNPNNSASTIKIYNTYGWWQTGAGNSCFGLGYNTATGIVPADSNMAGTRCRNGVGGPDLKIMGLLQVSEEEQTLTRKYTTATLPKNIDRRVIFDNALIFAIATNNRIGTTPKSCIDWTDDEVQIAAEKHFGSCYISATRNYCNEILRLYKQYR